MDFSLAYGPLAYLHVITLKNPGLKLKLPIYLHFLPSFLIDGVLFTAFFTYGRSHMEWAYANLIAIQTAGLTIAFISAMQLGIYTFLIYKETQTSQFLPKEFLKIRGWFRSIVFAWLLILVFIGIAVPIALLNIEQMDEHSYLLYKPLGIINGICIYGLGYLYLLKYMDAVGNYMDRMARSKFSENELHEKKQVLLNALGMRELYKDPSISVAKLARQLGWPINDVSLTINKAIGTNFNDLVNQYRIQAFKRLAHNPASKKYSIAGLGQEVGFSSKASFYRAFKKETGLTPTAYFKSINQE